jgi:hypothetical protein
VKCVGVSRAEARWRLQARSGAPAQGGRVSVCVCGGGGING